MTDTSEIIQEITLNLKATVTSNKGGVLLKNIESDYINIIGEPLQYKKLGYNSLLEFIKFLDAFKIEKQGCDTIVRVLSSGKTQHLEEMIKKQKTAKKPKSRNYGSSRIIHSKNTSNCNGYSAVEANWKVHNKTSVYSKKSSEKKKEVSKNNYPRQYKGGKCNDSNKNATTHEKTSILAEKISENKKDIFEQNNNLICKEEKCLNYLRQKDFKPVTLLKMPVQKRPEKCTKRVIINPNKPNNASIGLLSRSEEFKSKITQLKLGIKCKKIVTITATNSPSSMWILLDNIEENSDFLEMQVEFNKVYRNTSRRPIENNPVVGHHYALYHHQKWYRIIIECIDFDYSVVCFCIDTGKTVRTHRNQIYSLEHKFYDIPGQAIECTLHKLKILHGFPFIKDILTEILVDKKCILISSSVVTYPSTVTLYDLETMINLNDLIIKIFCEKVTPTFPPKDIYCAVEAEVLSIEGGYVFLRKNKELIKSFEELFSTDQFSAAYLKTHRDVNLEHIYLASYKHGVKGRVQVVKFIGDSQVKVFFVDYGTYNIIEVTKLINLQSIDTLFTQIPCQAVKVILHLFPPKEVNSTIIDMFYKILGNNTHVSVLSDDNLIKNIPCVQLMESNEFPHTDVNMILFIRIQKLKKNQAY